MVRKALALLVLLLALAGCGGGDGGGGSTNPGAPTGPQPTGTVGDTGSDDGY